MLPHKAASLPRPCLENEFDATPEIFVLVGSLRSGSMRRKLPRNDRQILSGESPQHVPRDLGNGGLLGDPAFGFSGK